MKLTQQHKAILFIAATVVFAAILSTVSASPSNNAQNVAQTRKELPKKETQYRVAPPPPAAVETNPYEVTDKALRKLSTEIPFSITELRAIARIGQHNHVPETELPRFARAVCDYSTVTATPTAESAEKLIALAKSRGNAFDKFSELAEEMHREWKAAQTAALAESRPPAPTPPMQPILSHNVAATAEVYIAPYSGKKYHRSATCRGLRNAREVQGTSLASARAGGRDACAICN